MQCVPGFFPGVKRPWRLTGHSTPTSAEIKNEYTYPHRLYGFLADTGTNLPSINWPIRGMERRDELEQTCSYHTGHEK